MAQVLKEDTNLYINDHNIFLYLLKALEIKKITCSMIIILYDKTHIFATSYMLLM